MPLEEFLTLFIFCTVAFKKKCMRSLHAYTPVSGSFPSEPLDQSVNGTSIRSFKKRKVVACVTIYKQTNFRRAEINRNKASFSQPMMHHL